MKPRLIVEQRLTAFVNQCAIYAADQDGNKGELIAFAQQKRLAFKEKINFYTDTSKNQLAFTMRAEKVMDIHGRYFVEDPAGKPIGVFRKDFKQSLASSTWHILDDKDNPSLTFTESSVPLAIFRRYGELIPFIGIFIELIVLFLRYHFTVLDTSGKEVGKYQKTTLIRDHYRLELTDEAFAAQDIRVLAAQAVALDALQSR